MSIKIKKHVDLLGHEVTDKVTGLNGIVTSISFDLYGCIQALVTPKVKKDGDRLDNWWYDVARLTVKSKTPVMDLPNYDYGPVADGRSGPASKPTNQRQC